MKKKFENPELVIVLFGSDDVIVTSSGAEDEYASGDRWGDDDD